MKWICVLIFLCGNCFGLTYCVNDQSLATYCNNAADMWGWATDTVITNDQQNGDIVITSGDLPDGVVGRTWMYIYPVQIIMSKRYPQYTAPALEHEFGHALGLGHNNNSNSIMYHTLDYNAYGCQEDIDNIRSLLGLSPKVIDFNIKQKRNRVQFFGPCLIQIAGYVHYVKSKWVIQLPKGTYEAKMIIHNFLFKRTVLIK